MTDLEKIIREKIEKAKPKKEIFKLDHDLIDEIEIDDSKAFINGALFLLPVLMKAIEQRDLYISLIGKYDDETDDTFTEYRNSELITLLKGET